MRFATVCSGIDAPAIAWNPLGWQQVFCSEIEAFPCAVLKHHHPEVPNYGDMLKFQEWPQHSIDVLIAGTPCQSFSVAGMRKGLHDPRGNLTLGFLGVVEKYHPDVVIWENVPGVLSDKTGAFGAFLGGLGELRYGFAYAILDAQWFGVAQRRERVFVVGCAGGDWRRAAQILSIPESLRWHPVPSREKGKSVATTIEGRAGRSGCNNFATSGGLIQEVAPPVAGCSNGGGANGPGRTVDDCEALIPEVSGTLGGVSQQGGFRTTDLDNTGAFVAYRTSGNCGVMEQGDRTAALNCRTDPNQNIVAFQTRIVRNGRGNMGDKVNALNAQSGRTGKGDAAPCVAYTLHGADKTISTATETDIAGSVRTKPPGSIENSSTTVAMQGTHVRRLTPRECERLQGFPDDFTKIPWRGKPSDLCPDGPRYKAIGNSMAVPVIRWIGQRIQKICA